MGRQRGFRQVLMVGAVSSTLMVGVLAASAPAVAAAPPVERTIIAGSTDVFVTQGLYARGAAGDLASIQNSVDRRTMRVAASADGSRYAYIQEIYGYIGLVDQRLYVRDAGGRLVRTVRSTPTPDGLSGPRMEDVALSPDGSTVVWSEYTTVGGPATVYRADVATGATSVVIAGRRFVGFLSADTLIVTQASPGLDGRQDLVTLSGVPIGRTVTLGLDPFWASPSPDGTRLVWSLYKCATVSCTFTTYDLAVGTIGLSDVVTDFTLTDVATQAFKDGSFSPDGATVRFVKGSGELGTVAASGGAPTITASPDIDEVSAAYVRLDPTPPGAVAVDAPVLGGSSVTFSMTLPADADRSALLVSRSTGTGTPVETTVPMPPTGPTMTWSDTGLALGVTYVYRFRALDRSGNVGPESERTMTALAVATSAADPVSATSTTTPFPVRFTAAGWTVPAGVTFNVDWTAADGVWRPWLRRVSGPIRTFGIAGDLLASTPLDTLNTGVVTTTSVAGVSYRFRVTAFDGYGNPTATLVSGPAVVPFDQTKATFSAGTPVTKSAAAWLGSFRSLVKAGQFAKLTIVGNRFQLVGWKCAACGVVDVFDGATRIGTVDTRSAKAVARTVLFTKAWVTVATRVITIKARGTAGRPAVQIDGFGVRR